MKLYEFVKRTKDWLSRNTFLFLYKKSFRHLGTNSFVLSPLQIDGVENITLGNDVTVHRGTWLAAMPLLNKDVELQINDGVTIGHYNHIYATQSIVIEKDVLTADKVYISDNLHTYEAIDIPVSKQEVKQCNPVVIGEGSWLGENVCVIGVTIGKHCVIGANSVVTHNIPDYSVAVGAPARVIKQYDLLTCKWIKKGLE